MDGTGLYRLGGETVVASWQAYAEGAKGAAVHHGPGVATAVFPTEPQRSVYNNALLEGGLSRARREEALAAMEQAYAAAGVDRFAAWVHEDDTPLRAALEARGYVLDTTTRAMGLDLADLRAARPQLDLAPARWAAYLDTLVAEGLDPNLLSDVDPGAFHVLLARLDGRVAAAVLAFDHGDDCGLYNLGTLPWARRRGLGTALTALLAHDARDRGRRTVTLQSTPMAERVYAAVGFRELGRILEYVPAAAAGQDAQGSPTSTTAKPSGSSTVVPCSAQ